MSFILGPQFLKAFSVLNILGLSAALGGALSMYAISLPVIKSKSTPTLVMLQQFEELIDRGRRFLQTGSCCLSLSLAVQTLLYYIQPKPELSSRWIYFGCALLVLVQVAWYEVVNIFPINDRLIEMKKEQEKSRDPDLGHRAKPEVLSLFESWLRWHIGRILIPLAATTIAIYGISY